MIRVCSEPMREAFRFAYLDADQDEPERVEQEDLILIGELLRPEEIFSDEEVARGKQRQKNAELRERRRLKSLKERRVKAVDVGATFLRCRLCRVCGATSALMASWCMCVECALDAQRDGRLKEISALIEGSYVRACGSFKPDGSFTAYVQMDDDSPVIAIHFTDASKVPKFISRGVALS